MNRTRIPTPQLTQIGPYRLDEAIARGGMGEIWRGRDGAGRDVAIKRLFFDEDTVAQTAEQQRSRLIREARVLERLAHDNIVRYLDAGLDEQGQPYLVLEWLEGQDLATRHEEQPLALDAALDVARQALGGLQACHAHRVVHRDIKPANLFLVPREGGGFAVKVVDLGLARARDEQTRLTEAGMVMGTLHYLAPEQARGERDVDHRVDIYAMGVILYELCTGRRPFCGDQVVTVLLKIVTETPPRPRQVRPELPRWLDEAIVRAMQRAPSDRFESAEAMLVALRPSATVSGQVALPAAADPVALSETMAVAVPTSSLEFRMVSLLCVEPVGTDPKLKRRATDAVAESGGLVHHLLGGQVIGIFGLDRTLGDEGLRLIRAGLAIREREGREVRLLAATVHVQVREGLQLKAEDLDRTMEALPKLPPGELIVDRPTRELVGARVAVKRVGIHDAVLGLATETASGRRVLGVETPTVGRETELATIRAAFYRAVDNQEAEAALLLGPLGIGKSRLVEALTPEFRERCALCLEARADSAKSKMPYGIWSAAILRLAGASIGQADDARRSALTGFLGGYLERGAAGGEALAFVGEALGLSLGASPSVDAARADPKLMRERVVAAFVALLGRATARGPVCLCFEDLQWADDESLALTEAVLGRLEEQAVFLLGTARPELLEQRPETCREVATTRVELRPIRRRPLERLVRAILGGQPVSPDLHQRIGEWCHGNPYLVEELLSWLVGREALVVGPEGWQLATNADDLELPAGIEAAIQGRLDQLAPELKDLLKGASVFGEVFWEAGCESLGLGEAAFRLERLERAEFVVPATDSHIAGTKEWSFRHPLVQQVAYKMLPPNFRRTLHRQAARWLEAMGENDAAWLAHHFYEGGDVDRAADYSARAGQRLLAEGNPGRATEYFSASLTDKLSPAARAGRQLGLVRALILLGRYDEAWLATEALRPITAELDELLGADVGLQRGRVRYAQGSYAEAEGYLEQANADLGDADPALGFEIDHSLFWVLWVQGRYEGAREIAGRLAVVAEAAGRLDQLCSAELAGAYCSTVAGDWSGAIMLTEQAVGHAREVGHPYREVDALTLLATAQENVGRYEPALAALEQALALATQLGTAFHQMNIHASRGRIALLLDRQADALGELEGAIALAEGIGEIRMLASALCSKARALCARREPGDLDLAAIVAQRALELAEQRARPVEAEAQMTRSLVALARGDQEEALDAARATVKLCEASPEGAIEMLLAAHEALAAAGEAEEAQQVLRRAHARVSEQAQRIGDPEMRASFLERVPHNARVVGLAGG